MDRITKEQRSWNMSRIQSRDTAAERFVRSLLHHLGYRFRINVKSLPGKPDVVLPRFRTVVLVHGCFWHRHGRCRFAYMPKSRQTFWETKFKANIVRDRRTLKQLKKLGWRVLVVWECETRKPIRLQTRLKKILEASS